MQFFKKIFGNKGSLVWFIVTLVVAVILIVTTVLATTVFYNFLNIPFGGPRRITAGGDEMVVYSSDFSSKREVLQNANAVNEKINEEGIILLKNENNALPLAKTSKISVFGKNSVNLVYGGSGSGGGNNTGAKTIYDSLPQAGFSYNPTLKAFYEDNSKSGDGRTKDPEIENSGNVVLETGETPQSRYTDAVKSSYKDYNDAALIIISRIGGEGFDLPRTMAGASGARNDSDHYLQLDANETELISAVCADENAFERIVVIINCSTSMELGFLDDQSHYAYNSKIEACLWIGGPGNSGIMALGRVLSGEINPSGRTVDTFARDFKSDPTWNNFGNNLSENGDQYCIDKKNKISYFVDYEEGIYIGYRYYETRGYTEQQVNAASTWYKQNVVFPFGYGKSYTAFDWQLSASSINSGGTLNPNENIELKIKVSNVGDVAGKDVIQVYVTPPYTPHSIEKPYVILCGFAKTRLLDGKKSSNEPDYEVLDIEIDPYSFASYDNNNLFTKNGGYVLERGEYILSIRHDSHDEVDSISLNLPETFIYENDPHTNAVVKNRFEDADDQLSSLLSRNDWHGTWPQKRSDAERETTEEFLASLKDYSHNNPEIFEEMPKQGIVYEPSEAELAGEEESKQVTLRKIIGKDYADNMWNGLLNQITVNEMINLFNNGAFQTIAINSIGKPKTTDADGPVGFTNFLRDPTVYDTCAYASECVVAATWNIELAFAMGESVGNEGIIGNEKVDGAPYSGWYAPGINLHRSPFGGRNFEYYSEDGFLSGILASGLIQGAKSKGVYTQVKHFALNEQETHRALQGLVTWADEQSIRENYLKPFELAVKLGRTNGMMSSFNRIGSRWTGGDYRLLTDVLRGEWGFEGMVICDFNTNSYMDAKQMAYAGGDLNLASTANRHWTPDTNSISDVSILRQCTKNILFVVANSNAMNGDVIGYALPVWTIVLIIIDSVIFVGLAVWGVFVIKKAFKKI